MSHPVVRPVRPVGAAVKNQPKPARLKEKEVVGGNSAGGIIRGLARFT